MCLAGWCALVYTAAMVTTTHALVSSSEEVIKQALVLIDVIRSGYRRHSSPISPSIRPITKLPNYARVPWPPPAYVPSFYAYGPRFRRFYDSNRDVYDTPLSRRSQKLNRQIQYDDAFGPHPGEDNKEKKKDELTSPQNSNKSRNLNPVVTHLSTTTSTTAKNTMKKTTEAAKETNTRNTEKTTGTIKKYTESPTSIITKTDKKDISKIPNSASTTANIMKLNYGKEDTTAKKVTERDKKVTDVDEPELEQAAEELKRETADTEESIQRECATTNRQQKASCRDGSRCYPAGISSHSWRFRGTTRVHLSRSSRPSIPLPDNNPFCHTNPESPLCRTFI